MVTKEQAKVLTQIKQRPVEIGRLLGFDKLEGIHNEWLIDMIYGHEDTTLQAHRGSYKTTCVSVALSLIMLLYPNDKTMFMRKTDADITEVIAQVKKILKTDTMRYLCKKLWGVDLELTVERSDCIVTNLASNDVRGTPQLYAMGLGGSITGKHFDRIFTDDIINVNDRTSKADREKTKIAYQELQNIKNRGGRIYNTGTPWHADDAFQLMPPAKKYDCYTTGLIDAATLEQIRGSMTASLFAANYELRHIAEDDVIFQNPNRNADPALVEQGTCHIDAAYSGEDYTAFTIVRKADGKYYVFGKLWRKHIDDVEDEVIRYRKAYNAGAISCEDNGDKGYLAKSLRAKGERVHIYHESTNKYIKITSYLKNVWPDVVFVAGTDDAYIQQICDYNENADHDDAPDSLASKIRELWRKNPPSDNTNYNYLM